MPSARLIAAVTLGLLGCRSPTQITLEITTDVKCPPEGRPIQTAIAVGTRGDFEARPVTATTATCVNGRIGALVIVPSGDRDEEVAIKVTTATTDQGGDPTECSGDAADCIVARRVIRFLPHTSLTLPVHMNTRCFAKSCGNAPEEPLTCFEGQCLSATVPDPSLCVGDGCSDGRLFVKPTETTPRDGDSGPDGGRTGPNATNDAAVASATACPAGMALVTTDNERYCIDEREVSLSAWREFREGANVNLLAGSWCGGGQKTTFNEGEGLSGRWPVSRVDWCDAFAYCKRAGKRLCRSRASSSTGPALHEAVFACAGPSNRRYPYGDTYEACSCNGDLSCASFTPVPSGTLRTCFAQGAHLSAPVADLVGNLWEWDGDCTEHSCLKRGGGYGESAPADEFLRCEGALTTPPLDLSSDTGFRCCADASSASKGPGR